MYTRENVVIFGIGYVGLSLGVMLSSKNDVTMIDIDNKKVEMVNSFCSPLKDELIKKYLEESRKGERLLSLRAVSDCNNKEVATSLENADFIIIAVSTDLNEKGNTLNTTAVESVIEKVINSKSKSPIIIKSTLPIGFTKKLNDHYPSEQIFFCPEFSRENSALYDNLYPDRIIVGVPNNDKKSFNIAKKIAELFSVCAATAETPVSFMGSSEAEAVKLFSNTYLAMRVAFFNELDSFALSKGLSASSIIDGMCLDPRIGQKYHNPSFGYGGYCLPKDSRQLMSDFTEIHHDLVNATIVSNESRKKFIAEKLIKTIREESLGDMNYTVGLYRLTMKSNSDNYRNSSILDILEFLNKENIKVVIYEPTVRETIFRGNVVENDIDEFKMCTSIIIANRYDSVLDTVKYKVFTRDLYYEE